MHPANTAKIGHPVHFSKKVKQPYCKKKVWFGYLTPNLAQYSCYYYLVTGCNFVVNVFQAHFLTAYDYLPTRADHIAGLYNINLGNTPVSIYPKTKIVPAVVY